MRQPPEQLLDPKAVRLWRAHAALRCLFYGLALCAAAVGLALTTSIPILAIVLLGFGFLVGSVAVIGVIPPIRYRHWCYSVDKDQLDMQRGVFVRQRTLVPLIRVQNVDSVQGPIAKHFGLSSVMVSTAASTHSIPALSEQRANELRDHISRLAQVARESV